MRVPLIVIDTNVFVSALKSQKGASHQLLLLIGKDKFVSCLSVPLVIEYEKAAKSVCQGPQFHSTDIDDIIDYMVSVSRRIDVYYLWRPFLRDPKDDMVLEVGVAAQCDHIVTFNKRDFHGVERFGISLLTPQEVLKKLGGRP